MKSKSALSAVALFTIAAAASVSCGTGSAEGDGGSSGNASAAGAGAASGTNSPPAGASGTAGASTSTAGSATGGNSGAGGASTGGTSNVAGGEGPNHSGGSGGGHDSCPPTEPPPNTPCVRGASGFTGCNYGDRNCRCPPPVNGSALRTWVCLDTSHGSGGDRGIGEAICPENAKSGDDCTAPGACPGQQCVCNQQLKVFCF